MNLSVWSILSMVLGTIGLLASPNWWSIAPILLGAVFAAFGLGDYLSEKWPSILGLLLAIVGFAIFFAFNIPIPVATYKNPDTGVEESLNLTLVQRQKMKSAIESLVEGMDQVIETAEKDWEQVMDDVDEELQKTIESFEDPGKSDETFVEAEPVANEDGRITGGSDLYNEIMNPKTDKESNKEESLWKKRRNQYREKLEEMGYDSEAEAVSGSSDEGTYLIGQTWTVPGQWSLTIDSVSVSNERNQFSEKNPAVVYQINYHYSNLGYENEIMDGVCFDLSMENIVDAKGVVGSSYPNDFSMKEAPIGDTCNAYTCIGLDNPGDFLIYVSQYDGNSTKRKATFKCKVS